MIPWQVIAAGGVSALRAFAATLGQAGVGAGGGGPYHVAWGYWAGEPAARIVVSTAAVVIDRVISFGDLFKGIAFLILGLAFLARRRLRWGSGT